MYVFPSVTSTELIKLTKKKAEADKVGKPVRKSSHGRSIAMHAGDWGRLRNYTEAKRMGTQSGNGNMPNDISAQAQIAGTHKGDLKRGVKVCKSDSCLNTLIQPFEQRVRHCSACMRAEQVIGLELERARIVLRLRPLLSHGQVTFQGFIGRFCQRCMRVQPLGEFDGKQSNCRAKLAIHNARRRKSKRARAGHAKGRPATDLNEPHSASNPEHSESDAPTIPWLQMPFAQASAQASRDADQKAPHAGDGAGAPMTLPFDGIDILLPFECAGSFDGGGGLSSHIAKRRM